MTKANLKLLSKDLYGNARDAAVSYVIKEARSILRANKHLDEFILAMGDWCFITKAGKKLDWEDYSKREYHHLSNSSTVAHNVPKYAKDLYEFMSENDVLFYITGEGIRFKAWGPIVRHW